MKVWCVLFFRLTLKSCTTELDHLPKSGGNLVHYPLPWDGCSWPQPHPAKGAKPGFATNWGQANGILTALQMWRCCSVFERRRSFTSSQIMYMELGFFCI